VTSSDLIGINPDPSIKVVWTSGAGWSGPNQTGEFLTGTNHSSGSDGFNLRDYPILSGVYGQRLCLAVISKEAVTAPCPPPYENLQCTSGFPPVKDQRLLTVVLPATGSPVPPPAPLTTHALTLSKQVAVSKAKAALAKKYGRAYRRGSRKRLSCTRLTATSYRCRYRFTYRRKRRAGKVLVKATPAGVKVTVRPRKVRTRTRSNSRI
jgi:hypothetical protein